MQHAEQIIKKWTVVGFVFAGLYALFTVFFFSKASGTEDQFIAGGVLLICVLFLIGSFSAKGGNYSAARVLWLIGGILGIPLGIVMIAGSNKISKAAKELAAPLPSPFPR